MGNYRDIEYEFIERTLKLIAQYESDFHRYPFEEQYNYTLLLNCLLGIIVLPKERVSSYIPNPRITNDLKNQMGLVDSVISPNYTKLRDLILGLRNSIAHFSVEIRSNSDDFLIDNIIFKMPADEGGFEIANFQSSELLPFIRYYADWIKHNLKEYR
ncbi:MAG: hypothetical protein K9I74_08075 [Bacteroidales bacterium]|nr:hypothetical protein [Bacteroidales bacterium]